MLFDLSKYFIMNKGSDKLKIHQVQHLFTFHIRIWTTGSFHIDEFFWKIYKIYHFLWYRWYDPHPGSNWYRAIFFFIYGVSASSGGFSWSVFFFSWKKWLFLIILILHFSQSNYLFSLFHSMYYVHWMVNSLSLYLFCNFDGIKIISP